jgi:aerobic C4-dicarboxylate transport protein
MSTTDHPPASKGGRLYLYVLVGVLIGAILGVVFPDVERVPGEGKVPGLASQLKPLADGFIALIKMMISPIIFCTVVLGIAGMADMRALGRVGGKAFVYFEVVSSLALVIGLMVANVLRPGSGFHVDPKSLDPSKVSDFAHRAADQSFVDYVLHIIPKTFLDAFTGSGDLLQVLLIAILFGTALAAMGERGRAVHAFLDGANLALFGVVNMIMKLAPIGAGAAIAFTIGKYGLDSLKPLAFLMGSFYLTCAIFIFLVLGAIAWATGFSLWRFLTYIKAEILTVLGTSSSESALVPLMEKLQRLGCPKSVVGVVVPAGYSFNLDGTNIYLTLAVHRPGVGHRADPGAAAHHPGGGDVDQQGRLGRHRCRLRHPRRDPGGGPGHPGGGHGPDPRHRSLHERGPRGHQLHRQRRRHPGGVALGARARHGDPAARARRPRLILPPSDVRATGFRAPWPRRRVSRAGST